MAFAFSNAVATILLRAAHDVGAPDHSVIKTFATYTGTVAKILYAKTTDGAAGYSYALLDGSFAEAAPATGDIITTVMAHGQLEDLKHRMNTAAAAAITPPGWTTAESVAYCSEWLTANTTNFSDPNQLYSEYSEVDEEEEELLPVDYAGQYQRQQAQKQAKAKKGHKKKGKKKGRK
jgi:hypothetical protein